MFIDFRTQKSYNSNIVAYLSSYCQVRDPSLTTKPPLTTQQNLKSSPAPEAETKLIITQQTAKDSDRSLLMLIALSATLLVSVIPLSIILVCLIKRKSRRPHIEMTKTVLVSSRIYQGLFNPVFSGWKSGNVGRYVSFLLIQVPACLAKYLLHGTDRFTTNLVLWW